MKIILSEKAQAAYNFIATVQGVPVEKIYESVLETSYKNARKASTMDIGVGKEKRFMNFTTKTCQSCGMKYKPTGSKQRFCCLTCKEEGEKKLLPGQQRLFAREDTIQDAQRTDAERARLQGYQKKRIS